MYREGGIQIMNYFIVAFNGSVARLVHTGGLSPDIEKAKEEIMEAFHVHFPLGFYSREVVKLTIYPLPDEPKPIYVYKGQEVANLPNEHKEELLTRGIQIHKYPGGDVHQHWRRIVEILEEPKVKKRDEIPAAVRKEIVLRKFEVEKDE
jgi:hypothetical protein